MSTIIVNGVERSLGLLPTPAATIARMHLEGKVLFSHEHVKLAARRPRADWQESDCRHFFKHPKDQDGLSSCVGNSGGHALTGCFAKEGFDLPGGISPMAVYAPVSGGYDGGASMGDCLDALQKHGAFLSGSGGIGDLDFTAAYRTRFWTKPDSALGAEALRYRVAEAVFCGDDVEAFLNGLQSGGWCGQMGLGAGNNFDTDAEGRLPSRPTAGINHALCATGGMKRWSDTWYIEGMNSWGIDWGLRGFFYVTENWLRQAGQELWLVRSTTLPA